MPATTQASTSGILSSPAGAGASAGQNAGGAGGATINAGGQSGGNGTATGFEATVQPFINSACNCHQSTPLMAPFSLKVGEAYRNVVNVPAMELPSMALVKPGSIEQSYLWHKIDGTQLEVGGSGMIMPYTLPLKPDEKSIFERWIMAGAPP